MSRSLDKYEVSSVQRITKICFTLSAPKFSSESGSGRVERYEFAEGFMENGERIGSLWFDLTSEFLTIMVKVAPRDCDSEMIRSVKEVMAYLTNGQAKVARGNLKSNAGKSAQKASKNSSALGVEDALRNMHSCMESIEERKSIYKVSDLVSPIELTSYIPPSKFEDFCPED